jgi:hypothetical protein
VDARSIKDKKIDCDLGWSFPVWKIRKPQSSGEIIFLTPQCVVMIVFC